MSRFAIGLVLVLGIGFGATPAYAYIDPGTGSLVLQILLGGIAGLLVGWKFFWHKIKGYFGGRRDV